MKLSKAITAILSLLTVSHGQVDTNCLYVSHSCRSRTLNCDQIEQVKCDPGESRIETVWISGKICNFVGIIAEISNPESLITISGPAALKANRRTDPILLPFPNDMTQLFPGQCAEIQDFELDIDLCQNGFNYEVAIETGTNCKGSKFISAMRKFCAIKTDIECSIVSDGMKCQDVYTAGYQMFDCIQDIRYDFSYSNQIGNEKDIVIFDVIKDIDTYEDNGNYTYVEINGTTMEGVNDYLKDIATGEQVSFSLIVPNVNVCDSIPNATMKTSAMPLYLDQNKREDYKNCAGSASYHHITREIYPSIAPIPSWPPTNTIAPTFSNLVPETSTPSVQPSIVPTLRKRSKGGKKKPKRGKAQKNKMF